ncbi:MAG: hypothetical protein LBS82_06055 [Spirochaetaceae bacterium]|jgi:hypothetical protein|nr:hypothetical protein [Spirochaetaceae bacterium]
MSEVTVNLNSLLEIRQAGLKALQNALGPVGMIKFIQQYENGVGDYTKEKYNHPDISLEEIDILLRPNKNR